ncbi:MAG: hypothetical protein Ct9H90mP13_10720 [Pseudomonadota bacterium]|nr:MAG: hypothetical protein Ct9H90mP13_10720 [Pseudomonadota bacterium]
MEMTFEETKAIKRNQKMDKERGKREYLCLCSKSCLYNGTNVGLTQGLWGGWLAHYARFPDLGFSTVVFEYK